MTVRVFWLFFMLKSISYVFCDDVGSTMVDLIHFCNTIKDDVAALATRGNALR